MISAPRRVFDGATRWMSSLADDCWDRNSLTIAGMRFPMQAPCRLLLLAICANIAQSVLHQGASSDSFCARAPLLFGVTPSPSTRARTLRAWPLGSGGQCCRVPPSASRESRHYQQKSLLCGDVSMVEGRDEPEQASAKKKKKRTVALDPLTPPPSADTFPKYAPRDYFRYEIIHQSKKSGARVGRIHTPHGVVDTPGYVPVATMAALKAVDHRQMDLEASQQLMFCNTYHLVLQPGSDLVEAAGGLHKFMGRDPTRPLITDSGGFQVLRPPAFLSCRHRFVLLHMQQGCWQRQQTSSICPCLALPFHVDHGQLDLEASQLRKLGAWRLSLALCPQSRCGTGGLVNHVQRT